MGWTNSVPIFHNDVTYTLQPEIPHVTQPYIDNVPVKGPATRYIKEDGEPETIPENPGIRWFIWEHFQDLNHIVQWMKYCGGTFSRHKSTLCTPEITVLGHQCTINGRLPDKSRVSKIVNWGPCKDLTDMHTFLGTIGVCRLFIKNFSHHAHHLVKLTRKGVSWEFRPEQLAAMEDLKQAVITSPALWPINYTSSAPVILLVNTAYIADQHAIVLCMQCTKNIKQNMSLATWLGATATLGNCRMLFICDYVFSEHKCLDNVNRVSLKQKIGIGITMKIAIIEFYASLKWRETNFLCLFDVSTQGSHTNEIT